jgi:hypothetical protein
MTVIIMVAVRVGSRVAVGIIVGTRVDVGIIVGTRVAVDVGICVGTRVAVDVGMRVGSRVAVGGIAVGTRVGSRVAVAVAARVGSRVAVAVGRLVAVRVGVRVAVGALTLRYSGPDTEFGPGLATVMRTEPACVAVPRAVSALDEVKTVSSGVPFHSTRAPATNCPPRTCKLNSPSDTRLGVSPDNHGVG